MRMLSKTLILAASVSSMILLSGCETLRKIDTQADNNLDKVSGLRDKARIPAKIKAPGSFHEHDKVYLTSKGYELPYGEPLNKSRVMLNVGTTPLNLQELTEHLARALGQQVLIDDMMGEEANKGGATQAPKGQDTGRGYALPPPPAMEDGASAAATRGDGGMGTAGKSLKTMQLGSYDGPSDVLLDRVSQHFGMAWENRGGTVRLLGQVTRVFTLKVPAGDASVKNSVNASSSSGNGSGSNSGSSGSASMSKSGAEQEVSFTSDFKIWKETEEALNAMLPKTAKVSVSPSSGTVTVTASGAAMQRASDYIDTQNKILSRQVTVDTVVISVTYDESDRYGLSLNAVFDGLNEVNMSAGGPTLEIADTLVGSMTAKIVNATGNSPFQSWNGTESIIKAISRNHKAYVDASYSLTTRNHQTAPLQAVQKDNYVYSVQASNTTSVTSTAITPGTATTGLIGTMTPNIGADGKVILRMQMTMSELVKLQEFSSGGSKVQLPSVVSRDFMQTVGLKNGQTLVLAGFERNTGAVERVGTGSPDNFLFGGGRQGEGKRELLIIAITPMIHEG